MKKILAIVLAVLMCTALFAGCAQKPEETASSTPTTSEPASEPAQEDATSSVAAPEADASLPETFVLGLDASFPPMGFADENNEIVGVDIDLAKAVCEKLGMKFEAKPIDWATKEMELDGGKITCIWNGLTVTPEREEAFTMTKPYMKNTQVIVVMNDSGIAAKADLAGKNVAAQTDSSGETALMADEIYASIQGGAHKQYADYVSALQDLEIGRIDAIVMDSVVANYYITENTKPMTILEDTMGDEEYAIAVKKGNDALATAIEGALSELAAEGKVAEISNKWFGRDDMIITY